MILVIDNYDSFIYNIVQYVGEFYSDIKIFRNDKITLEDALALSPDGVIISPGPGRPEDSKVSMELIKNANDIPVLGVCLGHQGIASAYGGEVVGAKNILHGKSSVIHHNGKDIFDGVSSPLSAVRYHSLVAKRETLPEHLEITAESDDGEIMGLKVRGREIYGIQFHPESILTEQGKAIIRNFVNMVVKKKEIKQSDRISGRIKSAIRKAGENDGLSKDEAKEMMDYIMKGHATHSQIGAYLMGLMMKGETSEEIAGSAESMFGVCVKVISDKTPMVDIVGTGGDQSGTFNISTASSFVAAGAGVYVAKHGNRSVTSKSGAADVLERLGVNIQLSKEEAVKCLDRAHIAFLFAPLYHPAMKYVVPVRREIGVRTLFNILGPMVNPAAVRHQVMGVYSRELLERISPVFAELGHKHSLVVFGEIGIDEASIEGRTFIKEIRDGRITDNVLDAGEYNLGGKLSNIRVDSPEKSKEMILAVLRGEEKGDPRKAIVLNSGLAIYITKEVPLEKAFELAAESIDSGRAYKALQDLILYSNEK